MRILPDVKRLELLHAVCFAAGRLVHHGAFFVGTLIMAELQNKILLKSKIRDARQRFVMPFSDRGIKRHVIVERIVHPADIPFEGKAEAAGLHIRGDP